MNWIPVGDRLPEPMKPVLIAFLECGRSKSVVARACWAPAKHANCDDWPYEEGAEYDEETDAFYWPEGWYEWNQQEECHWMLRGVITHWMPLPELPSAKQEGKP